MKRWALSALSIAAMVAAATLTIAVEPASASTTVGGYVECVSENSVVGVWVDAASGTDGWATRSGSGYYQHWQYTLTSGNSYSLHVGCGGSSSNWRWAVNCPSATGGHSFNVYDGDIVTHPFCQQV